MPVWTCPKCDRQFARSKQSHECSPAMSLDEYFSTGPPWERPIFDAVMAHSRDSGSGPRRAGVGRHLPEEPTHVRGAAPDDEVGRAAFSLRRVVRHRLIKRKPIAWSGRYWHVVNVGSPDDIDDDVKEWLTEAYFLEA